MREPVTLGVDCGTSGMRVNAVDADGVVVADSRLLWRDGDQRSPSAWRTALFTLLSGLPEDVRAASLALAIDGTSGTSLLVGEQDEVLAEPLMYNDACPEVAGALQSLAPAGHVAASTTSPVAKLLRWHAGGLLSRGASLQHQADWLAACLHGERGCSDWHNALKAGFDPAELRWPDWLLSDERVGSALPPRVFPPGDFVARLLPGVASSLGLRPNCAVAAGTTDSIAAFFAASGGQPLRPGDAVTSLGSTLALKLVSQARLDNGPLGVYSHRLPPIAGGSRALVDTTWLAGGASNTGGAVLRSLFGDADTLAALSARVEAAMAADPRPTGLDYYPLLKPGERFPVNDPFLPPRLSPRPPDDAAFLRGVLESMSRIEADGYAKLAALGGPAVARVLTAGGGARNGAWAAMRRAAIGGRVAVRAAPGGGEAAEGAALLARRALKACGAASAAG